MKSLEGVKAYTDYPFHELGDESFKPAPLREVLLLEYDGDKYVRLQVEGLVSSTKRCYLYTKKGRVGEVPIVPTEVLETIMRD